MAASWPKSGWSGGERATIYTKPRSNTPLVKRLDKLYNGNSSYNLTLEDDILYDQLRFDAATSFDFLDGVVEALNTAHSTRRFPNLKQINVCKHT
jgi:hypothetical protein